MEALAYGCAQDIHWINTDTPARGRLDVTVSITARILAG
jgi:hypothetical protein